MSTSTNHIEALIRTLASTGTITALTCAPAAGGGFVASVGQSANVQAKVAAWGSTMDWALANLNDACAI